MDIMSSAVDTHVYTIYFFLTIIIFNLYSVLSVDNFVRLSKRLRFMTPLYYSTNAVIIYTGAIVAAYSKEFPLIVILMLIASVFLLVIEIKRYKKMRVIKTNEEKLQKEFVVYAKKIYIIEINILIVVYILSKVF